MKRKIIGFFMVFLIVLMLPLIQSAAGYKMTLKYCNYSFNDPDFGPWNELEQKGVLVNVDNINIDANIIDSGNNYFPVPSYNYTTFQNERGYSNNLGSYNLSGVWPYNSTTKTPFLNFKATGNKLYIKCVNKIGNFRIFPMYYYPFYASAGGAGGLFITQDFNFTEGVYNTSSYIDIYRKHDPISVYTIAGTQWDAASMPYYIDNQVNPDHTYSTLISDGLYPNTELTTITRVDIDALHSGILATYSYFRENGHVDLYSPAPYNYFYINSTLFNSSTSNFRPVIFNSVIENLNTGEKYDQRARTPTILVRPGDTIKVNWTLKNSYGMNIDDVIFKYEIMTIDQWNRGVGTYSDSDPRIKLFRCSSYSNPKVCTTRTYNTLNLNFSSYETKEIIDEFRIPNDVPLGMFWSVAYISRLGKSGYTPYANVEGYDNITYIGFTGYDPSIEFSLAKNSPVFSVDMNLYFPSYNPNIKLFPGEYNLTLEVYDPIKGVIVDNFSLALDETEFNKMKVGNHELPKYNNVPYIMPNTDISYKAELVVDRTKYLGNADNILNVYSVKDTNEFAGKRIAKFETPPKFKSGDSSFYKDSNIFEFTNDSRTYVRYLTVFNPSFYSSQMNLSLVGFPANYSATYPNTIILKPLESKDIAIRVNATFEPWPKNNKLDTFYIKTQIPDQSGNNLQMMLQYYLDLTNKSSEKYFDFKAINLQVDDSTEDTTIVINGKWDIYGSSKGVLTNINKKYNVSFSLYYTSSGDLVEKKYSSFTILGTGSITSQKSFEGINLKRDYYIVMNVDSDNSITEYDVNENRSEDNNELSIDLTSDGHGRGNCTKFSNLESCDDKTHLEMCYWKNADETLHGSVYCKGCRSQDYPVSGCENYLNNKTCNNDPCGIANSICDKLLICSRARCEWKNNSKSCLLNITISPTVSCNYEFKMTVECSEINEFWEKTYSPVIGSHIDCSKTIPPNQTGSCNRESLDFFDDFNFFITLFFIVIIYIVIIFFDNRVKK